MTNSEQPGQGVEWAPLGWTQHSVWLDQWNVAPHERYETSVLVSFAAPPEATVHTLRQAVNNVVARFEALRTTVVLGADGPRQRVDPPRPLAVALLDEEEAGSPAADQFVAGFARRSFALKGEWPIRVLLRCRGAMPVRLYFQFDHSAIDGYATRIFQCEFEAVHDDLLAARPHSASRAALQPRHLAEAQASGESDVAWLRADEYWQEQLEVVPADVLARRRRRPSGEASATYDYSLYSAPLAGAVGQLAQRYSSWNSCVLIAAFAATMAAYAEQEVVGFKSLVGNRHLPATKEFMGCAFIPVLMHVRCPPDLTMSKLVRNVALAQARAARASYLPYDRVLHRGLHAGRARGIALRNGLIVNYLRHDHGAHRDLGRMTLGRSLEPREPEWRYLDEDLSFGIGDWPDSVVLDLNARSTVMDMDTVPHLLGAVERLLLTQADTAGDLTVVEMAQLAGCPPFEDDGQRWVHLDGSWIDLLAVERCLEAHPGVGGVQLEVGNHGSGPLVATVSALPGQEIDLAGLRSFVLGQMYAEVGARWPDVVRVAEPHLLSSCGAGKPDDSSTAARSSGAAGPSTINEEALAAAVCQANRLLVVDMEHDYVRAGGHVLQAPLVLELLAVTGYRRPRLNELLSLRPLRRVAQEMVADTSW